MLIISRILPDMEHLPCLDRTLGDPNLGH